MAEFQRAGLAVWLPVLLFAHAFAAFWLLSALASLRPDLWNRLVGKLTCGRTGAGRVRMPRVHSAEVWQAAKSGLRLQPLILEWEGVGCEYNTPGGSKTVLKDVSGVARPYELAALMGPSGAGKSTLLDILAGRKSVGRLSGRVCVNGVPRGAEFPRHVSYVPQEDTFLPTMTVAETCALHGRLLLPRGCGPTEVAARSDEVLAAMGLLHARDTLVGGVLPGGLSLRGLSGGERKRLSVAVGIMAAPSIIFLDEPTSGLDSCSALSVVEHLRERARDSGLTIVASIHQPRAAVWALFDSCALLSGGLMLYAGPAGGLVSWFESIGLGPWVSEVHGTGCDWAMDIVNIGFAGSAAIKGARTIATRAELEAAAAQFAAHYAAGRAARALERGGSGKAGVRAASPAGSAFDDTAAHGKDAGAAGGAAARSGSGGGSVRVADVEAYSPATSSGAASARRSSGSDGDQPGGGEDGALLVRPRPRWWTVFRALLWRELLGAVRNPADVAGRMLVFAWIGAACGVVFWRMGDSGGLESVHNRINVLFITANYFLLLPYVYLSLYTADKRHYTNDINARLYTASPYYAAKTAAVLPFVLLNVLASGLISYGMTGLRLSASAIATNSAAGILLYLIAQQVHSLSTIVMPNEDISFLVTIMWSAFNLFFSNFIIRFEDMRAFWLTPLRWLSAMYYAYSAYLLAEFGGGDTISCAEGLARPGLSGLAASLLPATPAARSPATVRMLERPGGACVINMAAVTEYFGVKYSVWAYLGALAVYLALMHVGTFCGLLLLARKERR